MFTDTCDSNAVQVNMENVQLAGFICFDALNEFFFYSVICHPLVKEKVKFDYNAAISAKQKMTQEEKVSIFLDDLCSIHVRCF